MADPTNPTANRPLRVGRLKYVNSFPVYYGLLNGQVPWGAELVPGFPTELNRRLAAGELDLSPISSIEYARHQADYVLLPELCLHSRGYVNSVLLFTKQPVEELGSCRVALANTSATTVTLARIWLEKDLRLQPQYEVYPPQLDLMLAHCPAALIIGDEAMKVQPPPGVWRYDLGHWWEERSGYAVVFVVWAVRREVAEQRKTEVRAVAAALRHSLALAHSDWPAVAEAAAKEFYAPSSPPLARGAREDRSAPPAEVNLLQYFQGLGYAFAPRIREGLLYFYAEAAELGICPPCPYLEFMT